MLNLYALGGVESFIHAILCHLGCFSAQIDTLKQKITDFSQNCAFIKQRNLQKAYTYNQFE